jgi:hypothetical protein
MVQQKRQHQRRHDAGGDREADRVGSGDVLAHLDERARQMMLPEAVGRQHKAAG